MPNLPLISRVSAPWQYSSLPTQVGHHERRQPPGAFFRHVVAYCSFLPNLVFFSKKLLTHPKFPLNIARIHPKVVTLVPGLSGDPERG